LWNIYERFHRDGKKMAFGDIKDGNGIVKLYDDETLKITTIKHYKKGKIVKTEKF
jgi:translation elongation factor P/translation initiation factor 5A